MESGDSFKKQCNAILDQQNVLEEDRAEQLTQLVKYHLGPQSSPQEIECAVLEIMWSHQEESDASLRNRAPRHHHATTTTNNNNNNTETSHHNRIYIPSAKLPQLYMRQSQENSTVNSANSLVEREEILIKTPLSTTSLSSSLDDQNQTQPHASASESTAFCPDQEFDRFRQLFNRLDWSNGQIFELLEKQSFDLLAAKQHMDTIDNPPSSHGTGASQQQRLSTVCRYFLLGECLRSDCKFSHDITFVLCRYWLQGGCYAGDSCIFLHGIPSDADIARARNRAPPTPRLQGDITFVTSRR